MNIKFESKFEKDLRGIKDEKLLSKLKQIILDCKVVENLSQVNNLKKLQGYDRFYRIRLSDYRIGLEIVEGDMIFTRILHRKDIYKFFP